MNPTGNYLKVTLDLRPDENELAVAWLSGLGFEAFEEEDARFHAFIPEEIFDRDQLKEALTAIRPGEAINPSFEVITPKNWNEEWERNFPPVQVDDFVEVIPSFSQPSPGFEITLRIEPKMSFGTGHHYTTRLVMRWCRTVDFSGKDVLDMGSGTGILGILASIRGAKQVTGVDNDTWCVENSTENLGLNHVQNMDIRLGGAEILPQHAFDVIMANINRNVLIEDGQAYCNALRPGGLLAVSGFFDFDENRVSSHFLSMGFESIDRKEDNGWVLLAFRLNRRSVKNV